MASPTLRSVLKGLRWPEKVVIGGVAASLVYTSLLLRKSHTAPAARYEAEWKDLAYEAKLADGLTTGGQMATSIRREVQAHEGGRAGRVPPPSRAGAEAEAAAEALKGRTIPPSHDIITRMSTAPPAAPATTGAGDGPGARSNAT
jgi:hypothetical protein